MSWNNLYEKAMKCLDWNMLRRTIATTLILSLLGTQMPLSSAAGNGTSGTGISGSQTESNAVPSKRDSVDDDGIDEEEGMTISGTITFIDDGTTDLSIFDDLDLRLYVNGELATGSNMEVQLDKSGAIIATGANAVIPLVNDLGSEDTDNGGRRSGAEDGFLTWNWYVEGLPEEDSDGVPYTYSIRDIGYHPATASNSTPIDRYALFYTATDHTVVDTDGDWTEDAWNLVYVQKGTIQGDFSNEDGAIPLASPANLIPSPEADEDEDYIGDGAYGWIDMGAGSWYIADALIFNPETGDKIIWRGQVDEDGLDGQLIRYDNIGDYTDFDNAAAYIYEGGTIVNCSTTCQVTGTIVWQDLENTYGKRPDLSEVILEVTDVNGELVSDVVIVIEEGNASHIWNYTITGLSVNSTYKMKAVTPTGYITVAAIEFPATADSMLQEIDMLISTPSSATIKAEVEGLLESESATLTYILWADEDMYAGEYSYTIYHADDTTTTGTVTESENKNKNSQIAIQAGETVIVQLIDTVADTVVNVTRRMPESSGVLCIKESADKEENLFEFQYSALKSVEVCIVWNDNNNQYNVRDYDRTEYLDAGKIHLYFTVEGEEIQYELSDPDDLANAIARLGLTEWNGFAETGSGTAAEWYYSTAGLPAYTLSAEGEMVEVNYWIEVDDADGYITTDKGWSPAPENVRFDSWKFIYTSKTKLEIEVLWLDDDFYNGARPDAADWKGTVTLYQISTNPVISEAERTKEIDLPAAEDSFSVATDSNSWKVEISDLPEYDEEGYPYTYYLVQGEVIPNSDNDILNDIKGDISYEAENSNTGRYSSKTDGCYQGGVIKNTLTGELEYSATKIWKDGDREAEERPTVTLTLWRYIKGDVADDEHSYAAAAQVFYDMNGEEVTVTLEGDEVSGYNVSVSGKLPAFDEDGHEYIYFTRESLSDTNAAQYICEIDNSSDGTVVAFSKQKGYDGEDCSLIFSGGTFTNRLTGKVNVAATKTWKAKTLQGMEEATITVALERKLVSADDSAWESVKDEQGNEVTEVIKGFKAEAMTQSVPMGTWDRYDEDANEYEYRMVEIDVSLEIGGVTYAAADFVYDSTTGITSYKIEVGNETYFFSSEVETVETKTGRNDVTVSETIVNQLKGETVVEIHKYWETENYNDLNGSVTQLYFHIYRNGVDICEELGGNGFTHGHGYLVMDVTDTSGWQNGDEYYHWKTSSDSLPKYDEDGAEYVYSIREQSYTEPYTGYSGKVEMWYGDEHGTYGYDHYGADVYNGKGETIPVVKNWLDDGDVLHREDVTVGLFYKGQQTNDDPLVLNKSNVWSGFFSIDPAHSVGDYSVKEMEIGEYGRNNIFESDLKELNLEYVPEKSYIKTDEHIYQVTEEEVDGQWVISNLRIGTIDIHLEKLWVAGIMEDPTDYEAVFKLSNQSNPDLSQTVTLQYNSVSESWECIFVALPKYDENGELYDWSLEEESFSVPADEDAGHYSSSRKLTTVYGEEYHTGDSYFYTATNTKNATDNIEFHKIWKDNNGKDGVSRPDIYLKLYRAVDTDGSGELEGDELDENKQRWLTTQVPQKNTTDDYHWIFSYSDLPLYNDEGYSYIYYAKEGMPASVSGGWKTVYLDSLTELGFSDYVRSISLEKTREDDMLVDGIVVNYRAGYTYVNGNKIWENMWEYLNADEYPYDLITLALYSAILNEDGEPIFDQEGNPSACLDETGNAMTTGIVYDSKTGNFTYDFDVKLPKYDEETGSLIRYYVKETLNGDNVGGFKWVTWVGNDADFKLENSYYSEERLSLKVTKKWIFGKASDANSAPLNGYPNVTFTLYRTLQKLENGIYSDLYDDRVETVEGPITLDRATGHVEFLDLPYYGSNGHPYRYYIRENSISGYRITVEVASGSNTYSGTNNVINLKDKLKEGKNEVTVTNIFTEETVTIKGSKTWSGDSGWNIRPDIAQGITLTLYRKLSSQSWNDGEKVEAELVWTQGTNNTWTYVFEETTQPFYRYTTTGSSYTYYVKEEPVPGYKAPDSFYSGAASGGTNSHVFIIDMTNTLDTTELKVVKEWEDNSNKYSTRPGSITVKLQRSTDSNAADNTFEDVKYPQDGGDVWTKTLTGSSTTNTGWTATFSGLPKYQVTDDAGEAITPIEYTYRAIEVGAYEDYLVDVDSNTSGTTIITNTLESCDLKVLKVWKDEDDQDGIRPLAVVVSLYKTTTEGDIQNGSLVSETNSGNVTDAFTLNEENGWTYTWSGLPQTSPDGSTYYYYVVEAGTADEPLVRYTVTYSSDAYATGTPQTKPVAVIPATGAADKTAITITNSYTPKKMSVSVEKVWVGADGETVLTNEEILPATITWILKSRFEGDMEWKDDYNHKAMTRGDENKYFAAWNELPVKGKDSSGASKVIEYRVEEIAVPGYETSYSGGESGVSGNIDNPDEENRKTITVTNRLKAETQAGVEKIWVDSVLGYDRTDEIATITFKLQRKLAADEDDFEDVTNAGDGSAVTKTITVSGINPISCVFEHLPRYDMSGYEYAYRVVEAYVTLTAQYGGGEVYPDSQDGLKGTIGGYTFDSEYTEAADTVVVDTATGSNVTITNTLSLRNVMVEKIWEDADNQDGVRPTAVMVELRYDGKSYDPAKTATLSNANEWKHEWENLPEKHADGTPFEYSVAEIAMAGLDESQWGTNNGYETSVSGISTSAEQPLTVTNSRTPETINYTVYKYWEDSNEYDWSVDRPDSIQVQLYRQVNQSEPVKVENGLVTLYAEAKDGHDAWTYTWTELPRYAREGEVETEYGASYEIQYSVKEVMSEDGSGYVSDIDGNKITNQLKTTQLTVVKNWEDQNNYYGIRPQTITIQLQRSIDGSTWNNVDGVTQELDARDSSQECTFIGLPIRDKNNNPYEYRAVETDMDAAKVISNAASGYKVSYEHEPNDETIITNTLETVKLTGTKTWEDQSNHYGARPESIKLTLKSSPEDALAEGLLEALVQEWSKNGNTWTYTYTGLPKYMADGKTVIVYSVTETADAVYEVSYDEAYTNLTNTMKTGSLTVTKIQEGGYATDFTFRVKLSINGVETLYTGAYTVLESGAAWNDPGEVRQTDESGAIVISRNQQFVITGLPAGAAYVVTEDPVNRFTLEGTVDSTGVIPYQNAATASFTNKYTYTDGGDDGGGTTPTQPGTEVPTEPSTEGTAPTVPESPPTPGDNGLVEIPGDPPSVIVEDPNGNIIYEGPTDNGYLDTSGWTPGTYTVYLLDDEEVPLGQMLVTIADNETPLAGLAKTGDTALPYALLIAIMLGAVGSMTALVLKRRKEEEE